MPSRSGPRRLCVVIFSRRFRVVFKWNLIFHFFFPFPTEVESRTVKGGTKLRKTFQFTSSLICLSFRVPLERETEKMKFFRPRLFRRHFSLSFKIIFEFSSWQFFSCCWEQLESKKSSNDIFSTSEKNYITHSKTRLNRNNHENSRKLELSE